MRSSRPVGVLWASHIGNKKPLKVIMMGLHSKLTWPSLLSLFLVLHQAAAQFNNPAGVDIWCGKAYRPA